MNPTAMLWPMVAHFVLVAALYALLGLRRRQAVQSGKVRPSQWKLRSNGEPEISATVSNNIMNQFELPVLFHVVCLALYVTAGVSWIAVILAWLFVALRYVHAFEHVTSNRPPLRGMIFGAGFLVLVLMWGCFALHLAGLA
ncbi:MAPEG family protein [Aquamicrobium terrae]|uniref:MAPEG family protein n=1 Tax=Aquamicrobium terrae TaxID=1324945 RepID=A0ABV2MU21_9HYPH